MKILANPSRISNSLFCQIRNPTKKKKIPVPPNQFQRNNSFQAITAYRKNNPIIPKSLIKYITKYKLPNLIADPSANPRESKLLWKHFLRLRIDSIITKVGAIIAKEILNLNLIAIANLRDSENRDLRSTRNNLKSPTGNRGNRV